MDYPECKFPNLNLWYRCLMEHLTDLGSVFPCCCPCKPNFHTKFLSSVWEIRTRELFLELVSILRSWRSAPELPLAIPGKSHTNSMIGNNAVQRMGMDAYCIFCPPWSCNAYEAAQFCLL
jgi:hypothetical protein